MFTRRRSGLVGAAVDRSPLVDVTALTGTAVNRSATPARVGRQSNPPMTKTPAK